MNATRVPIETRSASLSSGTMAARIETMIATTIVLNTGVCDLALTCANCLGSMPSRPIANRMRVCP